MDVQELIGEESVKRPECPLFDKWVLWAHLPHDTDWSLPSYKDIMCMNYAEDMVSLYNYLPEILVKNCMLFLMRKNISPTWEDKKNRNGGCFSYKINNKDVYDVWRSLSYILGGETISPDPKFVANVNGITISPKKAFCIIKIWMATCDYQDPSKIRTFEGLSSHGCIFKRHKPEY
jgi:hypothetical protein